MKKVLFIILLFATGAGNVFAQSMDSTERDSLYQVIDDLSNRVKAAEHQLEYISMVQNLNNQIQSLKSFYLDLKMMGADLRADLRNNTIAKQYHQHKRNFDATKELFNWMKLQAIFSNTSTDDFSQKEKDKIERLCEDLDRRIDLITEHIKMIEDALEDIEKYIL